MFTVVAWDADGGVAHSALTLIAGVADDHVRVVGDDIFVSEMNKLIGVHSMHRDFNTGGDSVQAQLSSPSLRAVALYDISRSDNNFPGFNPNVGLTMFPESPIPLMTNEALNALMINGASATTRIRVAAFLSDGPIHPVHGEIHTVRFTSVLVGVANACTAGNINFAQDLPVGRYQIVGASTEIGNTCGLFRFIPVGGRWRPGGLLKEGRTYGEPDIFRFGKLGVWMEFDQLTPPRLEVLETNAVNNPPGYIDLIKIA